MLLKDFPQAIILIQIPITMVGGIIPTFLGGIKMLRILKSLVALPLMVFKTRECAPSTSYQAPFGSSNIDNVIFALGILTSVVQNVDSKV